MDNKKITKATFKKFIKDNKNLFIKVKGSFDGMIDGIAYRKSEFLPITKDNRDHCNENTLGINGVWLVNGSRDWFQHHNDGVFEGIQVSNSCGSFILAKKI